MCSAANFPLRRSSEVFPAPGRLCGGPTGGPDPEMDAAWQELMAITELQELEAPGQASYETPQYQTYENTLHMAGYGTDPPGELGPTGPYGGYTDALFGHADQQLGHMAPTFSGPLVAPRVGLGPPLGQTQQIWTSHSAEDLESDSGLSLGSSPPLASPDVGVAGYHGLELYRDEPGLRAPSHYGMDFQHAASYPVYVAPQHPGSCHDSGTPSRGSPHAKLSAPLSRDERRALALKIPFPMEKIVNLPVDDFNELLSQYSLSDSQLALVRDIRRRGKNKVAAQNCRKRKLESIIHLERGLGQLQAQRDHLAQERRQFQRSLAFLRCRLSDLYAQVFAHLRDENGRPYSMDEYALQQTPDGKMYLVPFSRQEPC